MPPEDITRRTPPERDRYVDLLRAGSLLLVVLGHAFMALVTPQGQLSNTLVAMPGLQPVTWLLQIMPVFFLVGGMVTASSLRRRPALGSPGRYAAFFRNRTIRLLRPPRPPRTRAPGPAGGSEPRPRGPLPDPPPRADLRLGHLAEPHSGRREPRRGRRTQQRAGTLPRPGPLGCGYAASIT